MATSLPNSNFLPFIFVTTLIQSSHNTNTEYISNPVPDKLNQVEISLGL